MDFLKYLDVIIGLSIVMVLLSPLVTSVTQMVMWLLSSRSKFLQQSLQRLIVQLEGHPATVVSVKDANGGVAGLAGTKLLTSSQTKIGALDANGEAWFPDGLPREVIVQGTVALTVQNGAAKNVTVTRIPQTSRDPVRLTSAPADASGKTSLNYTFDGPAVCASDSADLIVKDAAGQPVGATVTWKVGQETGTVPIASTGTRVQFTRAAAVPPASSCLVEFDFAPNPGGLLPGVTIDAAFQRVDRFDRTLGPATCDANGRVAIETSASILAEAAARHPMVSRIPVSGPWPKIPPVKNRSAEVIEREELIRIVLELAANEGTGIAQVNEHVRESLRRLLAMNGVSSAADALAAIRVESQKLEAEEPNLALHVRHAKAIVKAAPSAFVGKINHWFDAAMARATQQYGAQARAITIVAALLVALVLQFDSLDLLRRLSVDDAFRTSLTTMAQAKQAEIEKLAAAQNADSTQNAEQRASLAAARDEIQQNLATLQSPDLAILPDHFVWQTVPRAKLTLDPLWTGPYPETMQLMVGAKSWDVKPAWRDHPAADLRAAIARSGAPVMVTTQEPPALLFLADTPFVLQARAGEKELTAEALGLALETELRLTEAWPPSQGTDNAKTPAMAPMRLFVDEKPHDLVIDKTITRDTLIEHLAASIPAINPATGAVARIRCEQNQVPVQCDPRVAAHERILVLSWGGRLVKDVRLLSNPLDPYSNRLSKLRRRYLGWRIPIEDIGDAENVALTIEAGNEPSRQGKAINVAVPDATTDQKKSREDILAESLPSLVQEQLNKQGTSLWLPASLRVRAEKSARLTLTSERRGDLELRYAPGKPETNVLWPTEQVRPWFEAIVLDGVVASFGPKAFGVLLSWVLMSLGAPFWFDLLKNALKLRPSAAATEERNSLERQQAQTTKP